MSQSSEWVYDYAHRAYFHTASQVYATIDPLTGQWQYLEAQTVRRPHVPIDDGGWGATLEDESGSTKRPEQHSSASNQQPIRLVVRDSTVLVKGQVALIDDREGGVQVGRDHCQAGAPPRLRVKEMEVSKTHAVFFHDSGAWFVVDSGESSFQVPADVRLHTRDLRWRPPPFRSEDRIKATSTVAWRRCDDRQHYLCRAHPSIMALSRLSIDG